MPRVMVRTFVVHTFQGLRRGTNKSAVTENAGNVLSSIAAPRSLAQRLGARFGGKVLMALEAPEAHDSSTCVERAQPTIISEGTLSRRFRSCARATRTSRQRLRNRGIVEAEIKL